MDPENVGRINCSGSLLHIDNEKVVILTAVHCTDAWTGAIAAGTVDSVGISIDQNNIINGSFTVATY